MYMWISLLVLIAVNQATCTSDGCPLDDQKCRAKASITFRYGTGKTYKQCVDENIKALTIRANCQKEGAEAAIAQKACSCYPRTLANAIAAVKGIQMNSKMFCVDFMNDMTLPTCDSRVLQCFKLGLTLPRDPDVIFGKCTSAQKSTFDEAKKCIEDMKTTDLSGCGSVVIIKDFLIVVSAMSKFVCSGCNIGKMAKICKAPSHPRAICQFILDDSKMSNYMECLQQKMTSTPECSSLNFSLSSFWKELQQKDYAKTTMQTCQLQIDVKEDYESWGCSGKGNTPKRDRKRFTPTKRDTPTERNTPTKEGEEMDDYSLLDLMAQFIQ